MITDRRRDRPGPAEHVERRADPVWIRCRLVNVYGFQDSEDGNGLDLVEFRENVVVGPDIQDERLATGSVPNLS